LNDTNPSIAEVTRGSLVESRHRGSYVVCDARGSILVQAGDVSANVFPRSAIKAFQCLPVIESGAADRFGLTTEEIALCCSSHNGEPDHVRVAASILAKSGASELDLECGAHWPGTEKAHHHLLRSGERPRPIHNNCSGKHAGLIALAIQLGLPPSGYSRIDHPVQRAVAGAIGSICDIDLAKCPHGIDGCSIPTWAFPLRHMALGFARLAAERADAGRRIVSAVRNHPFMVAGTDRFDTRIMEAVPRLFIKVGAEGVFCGTIAHAGLGFALKCDDGGVRAAEVAIAAILATLDVWTEDERTAISAFSRSVLYNWMKTEVGEVRAAF
jgi:L-asparaginase II